MKSNITKNKPKLVFVLLSCLFIFLVTAQQKILAQNELGDKVKNNVILLIKDYPKAMTEFKAMGSDAIPYIVKLIFDPANQTGLQQAIINPRLIGVIAQYPSATADEALIRLLTHDIPASRGKAIYFLGERKSKSALPSLILLLKDQDIYFISRSNSEPDKDTLIRDVAVDALEKITDTKLLQNDDYESKSKAWLKWWQKAL